MVCGADLHRSYNGFYDKEARSFLDERDETEQLEAPRQWSIYKHARSLFASKAS